LYIDDFSFEGAWIVDDHSQVSSYQELIARVLELIDAGYSNWEWYHIQLVVLIEYGESAIFCCQEDIIAHFSYPFEGDGGAELRVVDGGSLVSENPIAFFLICPDMPYVSASESVLSYLDEPIWICQALVDCKLVESTSQARRDIKANAVSVNQEKIDDDKLNLQTGEYILQKGKKNFARILIK
jgi:hypothetical protein